MLRALNQREMMNVNGGFYYIPVYDIYKYYHRVGGKLVYLGSDKKFLYTEQVASNSGLTERIRNTYIKIV